MLGPEHALRECGDASVCVLSEALDVGEEPERSVALVEEYARFGRVAAVGGVLDGKLRAAS